MDVSTPFLNGHHGAAPPKNPNPWKTAPSSPAPHPPKSSVTTPVPHPADEEILKALGETWKRIDLGKEFFEPTGDEAIAERLAELDVEVKAACEEDPQRVMAAAIGKKYAARCQSAIAALKSELRQVQDEIAVCPTTIVHIESPLPRLWGEGANWPWVVGVAACGVGATGFFGVEMVNATQLALSASWPFTETPWAAFLFASAFVAGPFSLLWWSEASAPPPLKDRLLTARRNISIALGATAVVAYGLGVGLEHGEVAPVFGEPEPWSMPVPALTVLSVSLLSLTMLAAKSGFAYCWDRLRGVEEIENPRLAELQKSALRLEGELAAPTESQVLADSLSSRLTADLVKNQKSARRRLRKAIAEESKLARRREAERRLRQAQAEMDRESD